MGQRSMSPKQLHLHYFCVNINQYSTQKAGILYDNWADNIAGTNPEWSKYRNTNGILTGQWSVDKKCQLSKVLDEVTRVCFKQTLV